MRKILTLLIAVFAAISLQAQTSGTCGDNLNWSYNESTKTLTITGSGAMTDYAAAADRPWHTFRADVESIVLPDGLTNIGAYAFQGCQMANLTFPESVTSIGEAAFRECYALTSIDLPKGLATIGKETFGFCRRLTNVTIPNSVTSLGIQAFYQCYKLQSVTIGSGVTTIPEWAFYNDTLLTTVVLPEGVTTIEAQAFGRCRHLSSINLPESVTFVEGAGASAFAECNALAKPLYNSHLFAYMPQSFEGEFGVPYGINVINNNAFYGCTQLTAITIPATVDSIGDAAFPFAIKFINLLNPTPAKLGGSLGVGSDAKIMIPYSAWTYYSDSYWSSYNTRFKEGYYSIFT